MLNEMMTHSMAPVAEVGARQAQGMTLNTGGQDARDASGTDNSFAVAMTKPGSGAVSETTGVSLAVSATSSRVGIQGDMTSRNEAADGETLDPVAEADQDGDGVLSEDEVYDAIVKGIQMSVVTEMGKNSQKVVADRMKDNAQLQAQIQNGGRRTGG